MNSRLLYGKLLWASQDAFVFMNVLVVVLRYSSKDLDPSEKFEYMGTWNIEYIFI